MRNLDYDVRGRDIPRDLFGRGRIKFSCGVDRATDKRDREYDRRRAQFEKLRRWGGQGNRGAWRVLHALVNQLLAPGPVADRLERGGEDAVRELVTEIEATGRHQPPSVAAEIGTLCGDLAARDCVDTGYLAWYKRNRKDNSLRQTKSRLGMLAGRPIQAPTADIPTPPTVGDTRIDQLTRAHVEYALSYWSRGNSQRAIHTAGEGLYTWSIGEEAERARVAGEAPRWSVNPFKLVPRADSEHRDVTASEDQVLALLAAAELYQRAYLRAFIHAGLREDELIHTRDHLDLDLTTWLWVMQKRAPDIRCACKACGGKGWSPKVKRSHRTFEVPSDPADLRETLSEYLGAYPIEPGDFTFRDARGKMWNGHTLDLDFKKLCARAGVKYGRKVPGGIVIHDLRATCITRLLLAGADLGRVAVLVGDSADTLLDRYFRPTAREVGNTITIGPRYAVGAGKERA